MVGMTHKAGTAATVAANVRAEVAANGMTIKDLGRVLGLGERAASRRWHGETPYSLDELGRIADYFEIPWADLAKPRRTPAAAGRAV